MGQLLSQLYVHLIFGTKGRHPYINEEIGPSLHNYMAGIFKGLDCPAIKINSVPDHVHILFRLSKNQALASVVENVKKQSSKWMKEKGVQGFTWQIGYGAFSVGASKVEVVTNYIIIQKEHQQKTSFKDEIEDFMREYEVIAYDLKYFWT